MDSLLQSLTDGVVLGSVYNLVAIGFAVIFSIMGVANLAHGEIYTIGAYVAWAFLTGILANIWIAIILALVAGALLGLGMERLFRPVMKSNMFTQLLIAFALSIALQETMIWVFDPYDKGVPLLYPTILILGPVRIMVQRLIVVIISLLLTAGVFLFFGKHKIGKAMRATASDGFAAGCCGIKSTHMSIFAFMLAGSLAAVAGSLLGPLYSVNPFIGSPVFIIAMLVCIIGGLGSIGGAALFGYLFGITDSLIKAYVAVTWSYPILYAIFFIVLLIRPSGLFGKARA